MSQLGTVQPTDASAIRPFHVNVPEAALVELRRRLAATRWPDQETVLDRSQGIQLTAMQGLARYWATDYDWRKAEAKLNAVTHFVTEIDALDFHFIHVRSPHRDALPLIMTHGWPGSVVELLKVIEPLTDPTAHGGHAEDAFDLVLPSLPGFGFSGKPTSIGWDVDHLGPTWAALMQRLGYTRYVAQGGGWGAAVAHAMARQAPLGLLGIHLNLPATVPPSSARHLRLGDPPPANLSEEEKNAYTELAVFYKNAQGHALIQASRPQTIGYSLADSPIGLAAWFCDTFGFTCTNGAPEQGLTYDDILDNITLYWLTNTAASAARIYWESHRSNFHAEEQRTFKIKLPVAVSVFPGEIYRAPRSWTERAYPNLIYFNAVDKGGHFAAWEQPQLFTEEIRAAFRPLRSLE